ARREEDDVAGLEHALALGRPHRRLPAQDDDGLLVAVMEVVEHLRLPGRQLVQAHGERVTPWEKRLRPLLPAGRSRIGRLVPLFVEDVHAARGGSYPSSSASSGSGRPFWPSQVMNSGSCRSSSSPVASRSLSLIAAICSSFSVVEESQSDKE